jgi:hypothetical protein
MKTKTAYRPKNNSIPAEQTPAPSAQIDDQPIQPSETTHIEFSTDAEPVEVAAVEPATPVDEATLGLQRQITDLKKSEELQRQRATQMMQQRPLTREEKLASWRAQGANEDDLKLLANNPEMVDFHDLTAYAANEAAQQHQRGTAAHREATREVFYKHLVHLQEQAQAAAAPQAQPAAVDPAGFFQPRPAPPAQTPESHRAAIVSAPVSRRDIGGPRELSPRHVKLTPEEQQIARASGISDVAYAEGKLRMMKAKANGELQ